MNEKYLKEISESLKLIAKYMSEENKRDISELKKEKDDAIEEKNDVIESANEIIAILESENIDISNGTKKQIISSLTE